MLYRIYTYIYRVGSVCLVAIYFEYQANLDFEVESWTCNGGPQLYKYY